MSPLAATGFLHVVAAVIRDAAGKVLVAKRPRASHQGGLWEFPGGKVEPGESAFDGLRRELAEELGLRLAAARPLIRVPHRYPQTAVLLDVWEVDGFEGQPEGREGQPLRWLSPEQLDPREFPAADRPVIAALQFPPYYLITPEPGPKSAWDGFLERLERPLALGVRLVQLRAKALDSGARRALSAEVVTLARRWGAKLLINGDVEGAAAVGADGVHLTEAQLLEASGRPLPRPYLVAASCHDDRAIGCAEALDLDFAVLSPVKPTRSHPGVSPLGWESFAHHVSAHALPLYGLGGLGKDDLAHARAHGAVGIAAIRGLWDGGR